MEVKIMKKALSVILSVILILSVLPLASFASESYDIFICGVQVTSDNAADLSVINGVEGTVSYNAESNTLYLDDATVINSLEGETGAGIQYLGEGIFTINVSGTNTVGITAAQTQSSSGIAVGKPGVFDTYTFPQVSLVINLSEGAILTATGGTAEGGYYPSSYGIAHSYEGDITVQGAGRLNATSGSSEYNYGITAGLGKIYLNNGVTVNAVGSDGGVFSVGIAADDAVITDATVIAQGGDASESDGLITQGGWKNQGDIIITNGSLTAIAGTASVKSCGIYCDKDFTAADSVILTEGKAADAPSDSKTVNSAGIYAQGLVDISGDESLVTATGLLAGVFAKTGTITVSGGTITGNGLGNTEIDDHGYNGIGIRSDAQRITFSGENTVISAKGRKTGIFSSVGITIEDPLAIVAPVGGKFGFANMKIVEADGTTNATDVLIKVPEGFAVHFDSNGGTGEMADVEFDGVTEYELPDCSFTAPDGLEFDRWDLGEVGDTITVSGDTTLNAQWWKGFPDVHRGDWFYNYVKICAKAGIVKGYSNGNFGPNDSLQRQDFVLILARLYGANLDGFKDAQCTLSDVKEGQYYTEAIKWAVYTGIITGYNNGKFGVGDKITREQIATIIYRLALMEGFDEDISEYYEELDGYVDAGKVSTFAKDGMAFCVHNKIITGKKDIYLAPTDNASRAEITAIIVRSFS